jgi:hypothetical protein
MLFPDIVHEAGPPQIHFLRYLARLWRELCIYLIPRSLDLTGTALGFVIHYRYPDWCRFPFLDVDGFSAQGSFARVKKFIIHPEYLDEDVKKRIEQYPDSVRSDDREKVFRQTSLYYGRRVLMCVIDLFSSKGPTKTSLKRNSNGPSETRDKSGIENGG